MLLYIKPQSLQICYNNTSLVALIRGRNYHKQLATCYLLQTPKDTRRRSVYIDLETEELLAKSFSVVV
jgi:hypothetical protein